MLVQSIFVEEVKSFYVFKVQRGKTGFLREYLTLNIVFLRKQILFSLSFSMSLITEMSNITSTMSQYISYLQSQSLQLSQLIVWVLSDGRFAHWAWKEIEMGKFRREQRQGPPTIKTSSFHIGSLDFMVGRYLL